METHKLRECSKDCHLACCHLAFKRAINGYGSKVVKSLCAFEQQIRDGIETGDIRVVCIQGDDSLPGEFVMVETIQDLYVESVVFPETLFRGTLKKILGHKFGVDCIHEFPEELNSNQAHWEQSRGVAEFQVEIQKKHQHHGLFSSIAKMLNGTKNFMDSQLGKWLHDTDNCYDIFEHKKYPARFFKLKMLLKELEDAKIHFERSFAEFEKEALLSSSRAGVKRERDDDDNGSTFNQEAARKRIFP